MSVSSGSSDVEILPADTDLLLIGGGFFGYSRDLMAALSARGRRAVWFEDRPATDTATKAMARVMPLLIARRAEAYFQSIAERVTGLPIRDVLVIKGESLSMASIARLRNSLPQARFTLYFWDSYRNMPRSSPHKVELFDRTLTFDPVDAANDTRLRYRPLWFSEDYGSLPQREQDIDLLFIGTVHTDRYAVLDRLRASLSPSMRFESVLYFPSRKLYYARKLFDRSFDRARSDDFVFKPLDKTEIRLLVARSRIVVDIERPVQSGLTMRTIEILGAGRKLVTTNRTIEQADFFDKANVAVIDRNRPALSNEFLSAEYSSPSPELLSRYSLTGWLDEVVPS